MTVASDAVTAEGPSASYSRDHDLALAGLFDASPKPMWVYATDTLRFLEVNATAISRYGYSRDEFLSMTIKDIGPPEDVPELEAALEEPTQCVGAPAHVWRHRTADGTVIAVDAASTPVLFAGVEARLVVVEDVTRRVERDAVTDDIAAQLREAQLMANLGSWRWDVGPDRIIWSEELCRIFALEPGEAPPTIHAYLSRVHAEDRERVQRIVEDGLRRPDGFEFDHRIVVGDGTLRWLRARGRAVSDRHGRPVRMLGVYQDVTDQKMSEENLTHQALHDPLTGLPNRSLFLDRLDHALSRLARRRSLIGVLFVDLDRFKVVNDSMGHAAGDVVLGEVADRLRSSLRPGDTVARFGGDEFAILCEDLVVEQDAVDMAVRVIEALSTPVAIEGQLVATGASVGIAVTTETSTTPEAVLRDADLAMYRAKEAGRGRYVIFDRDARLRAEARTERLEQLRRGLEGGELRLLYQPEVNLHDDASIGVEALVRWDHPELGLLGPAEFIALAEETGLIIPLGEWVLAEACRTVARLSHGEGRAPLSVSVNLSARQLTQASFIDAVWRTLDETGLEPSRLCLEITESVLMEDVESSIEALLGLKALGVRIAIDDFGTGYSSLSYLRRFPVDVVKIDRSFVVGLGTDPAADAIVAAVINLSHALGLRVVAEGVETEEQLLAVRALRCDRAQGFYWSPAVPPEALGDWATAHPAAGTATEAVELGQLLADRTKALRVASGRPVVLQAPPKLGAAVGELGAVKNVLDHLLGNAVKFSSPDRPIVVSAASDRHWVRVSVTDFGIGMTADESSRCFEQFWQADERSAASAQGTGIGLYIVRSLIDAMGGHVGVKSVKGKGSTFTFALPRSARGAARGRQAGAGVTSVGEDSTIREFMRQIGVPKRRSS